MTISPAAHTRPSALTTLHDELTTAYAASRPTSARLFERAALSYPGAETRSVTHYWPFPSMISRGSGAIVVDVDGIEYLDLVNNYTSLVHGNAFPPIAEAISAAARHGTVFPSLHVAQVELAEEIITRVPAIERLRLTNSGSEAAALALRIARRATGRRNMVVIEGAYHGSVPPFTGDEPEVRTLPFGDIAAIEQLIDSETAAVFAEPFLGAGGVIQQDTAYLRALQERARAVGAVFVFDEVQSLRNAHHGAAVALGLEPDLVLVAKIIGGGLPIGGVGGRADLLDLTSAFVPGRLSHAGTFNGHVAAAAAGTVSLRLLDAAAVDGLNSGAERLATAILAAAEAEQVPMTVTRAGSILNVHPGSTPVTTPEDARRGSTARAAFHLALMLEGVYTTPRGMINLSTVIDDRMLDDAAAGYARAFARMRPAAAELAELS
jgi:glutamate-1-semialdehyde 2,1-aminomutase